MNRRSTPLSVDLALIARLAAYALAIGLVLEAVVTGARSGGVEAWMREDGIVETIQVCLGFAAGVAFVAAGARHRPWSALLTAAGFACLFSASRELDGLFRDLMGPGGYKILAVPMALSGGAALWAGRRRLGDELACFVGAPAFWLVFCGALLILIHAQILGQKELWNALLAEDVARTVKKTFEECSELTGYCLLLCAALEAVIASRLAASDRSPP